MKSKALLDSFIAYCTANPEQRFWQALRNWCGWSFVYVSQVWPLDLNRENREDVVDTYYWEENQKHD